GNARSIGLHVFRIDAVIADHRRGHHHNLTEVGWVGEHLLVSAQIRGENDFRVSRFKREGRSSGEPGAVLEKDVGGCWARAGDCAKAAAPEPAGGPSVEFRWGAGCSAPVPAPVPGPRAPSAPACRPAT